MKKNKETTIEELALMVQRGFESTTKEIRQEIKESVSGVKDEISGEINGVKGEVSGLKDSMEIMSKEINSLQRGQVRIEDRLDEMSSNKKVLEDHDKRISILEKKVILAN